MPIRLVDRSRVELDWTCPRARFWSTEFEGRGIAPQDSRTELIFGSTLHGAFATVLSGAMADPALLAASIRTELLTVDSNLALIGEGLFWAFLRYFHPWLMQQYEVVSLEKEVTLHLGESIYLMVKPDCILRRKADRTLWYVEWKTTGFNNEKWINSWRSAIQLHAGCVAIERELGEELAGSMVVGLYKGYKSNGTLYSPLVAAYYKAGVPGVIPDQWRLEWTKGWERTSLQFYPGGMQAWVKQLALEKVRELFPTTPAIPVNREMVESFVQQQFYRERQILEYANGNWALDEVFPQHFRSCTPAFGNACPFRDACWCPTVGEDPLASGLYRRREPHHQMEIDQMEGGDE